MTSARITSAERFGYYSTAVLAFSRQCLRAKIPTVKNGQRQSCYKTTLLRLNRICRILRFSYNPTLSTFSFWFRFLVFQMTKNVLVWLFVFVGCLCVCARSYPYENEWGEFFRDLRDMRAGCSDFEMCESCARQSGSKKAFNYCCQNEHDVNSWCKKFLSFGMGKR